MIDPVEELRKRMNRGASASANASAGAASYDAGGADEDPVAAMRNRFAAGQQQPSAPAVPEEQAAQPVQPAVRRPAPSPLRPGRAANVEDGKKSFSDDPFGFVLDKAKSQANKSAKSVNEAGGKIFTGRPDRDAAMQGVFDQLGKTGWDDWQNDQQYRRELALQMIYTQNAMRGYDDRTASESDRQRYRQMQSQMDMLQQAADAYQQRRDFFSAFQDKTQYDDYLGADKSRADAHAEGLTDYDWYKRLSGSREISVRDMEALYEEVFRLQNLMPQLQAGYDETGQPIENYDEWQRLLAEKQRELEEKQAQYETARRDANRYILQSQVARSRRFDDIQASPEWESGLEARRRELAAEEARVDEERTEKWGEGDHSSITDKYTDVMPQANWTQDERDIFAWYLHYNKEVAEELALEFNREHANAEFDQKTEGAQNIGRIPVVGELAGLGAKVVTFPLGIIDRFNQWNHKRLTGHAMPRSNPSARDYANAITQGAATRLNEGWTAPEEWGPLLAGKGWGDVYQLGTSAAESAAAGWITKGLGLLGAPEKLSKFASSMFFYSNAASETTQEALRRGVPDEQALWLGTAAGLSEVLGENISLDHLIKMDDPVVLRDFLWNALKQSGVEASEEAFTTIMNTVGDAWIMGDKSELREQVRQYMLDGMTREEAEKRVIQEWANGVAQDALGGFVSGGMTTAAWSGGSALSERAGAQRAHVRSERINRIIEAMDKAGEIDAASANPDSNTELIRTLETMNSDRAQRRAFKEKYHMEISQVIDELRTEDAAQNQTPAAPAAESTAQTPATGEEMLLNPVRPQEAAGAPVAQEGTETAAQAAETPTAQAPVLNSNEGATAGETGAPSQMNIDNAADSGYNNSLNSGMEGNPNDQRGSAGEAGEGVAPGEGRLGAQYQSGDGSGRGSESAGIVRVNPELQQAYEKSGVVDYELRDSSGDSAAYSSALEEGRNSDPKHGWMVTPQKADELQGKTQLLAPDNSEGVVVAKNGDIEGVFKNQNTGKPGALMRLLPQAVAAGGTKLDCYGEGLVFQYAPYGFIPVARVEFNEKYANPGWDPSKGRPYVYVMMHDGSSPAQMVENKTNKNYRKWTMGELDALPTYDKNGYDDATAYRDSLMQERAGRYAELGEQYGTIEAGENPARESAVPRQIDETRKTGETVRTIYEAGATPERRLSDIEKAVVDGKFSYVSIDNETLADKASEKVQRDGWEAALRDWTADVRAGKANENLVAMGATLLNNAANSGMDGKTYVDLATDYNRLCHALGRGLAAARILKTLSPEAKLYGIQKSISRMNEELAGGKKGAENFAGAQEAMDRLDRAKDAAMENTQNAVKDPAGEAAKLVAEAVKRKVDSAAYAMTKDESEAKPKTTEQQMAEYAIRFAKEKLNLPKRATTSETATDVLRMVAQNESTFREIYEKAQDQYRGMRENMLSEDEDRLAKRTDKLQGEERAEAVDKGLDKIAEREEIRETASEPFQNTPVGLDNARGSVGTKTFAKAIAESAVRTGENTQYIQAQTSLGVSSEKIAAAIANDLIQKTGASGQLADSILEGSRAYVNEAIQKDSKLSSERVSSTVSKYMREIARSFRELAAESRATKESVEQDLADIIAIDYAVDPSSAKAISRSIVAEYQAQLEEAVQKELNRRFGEKTRSEKEQATMRNKLAEAMNLGAFDSQYAEKAIEKIFGVKNKVTLDPKLVEEYMQAETDAERDEIIGRMQQNIADQIPSTLYDKWVSLRYLNMLGNFKTQIRNVLGNLTMMATASLKNHLVRGGLENIAYGVNRAAAKATGGKVKGAFEREVAMGFDRHLYADAWADFKNVESEALGEKRYSDSSRQFDKEIQGKRRIWKNNGTWGTEEGSNALLRSAPMKGVRKGADLLMGGLNAYSKLTEAAMEYGDQIFSRMTYADAMASWMKAHKVKHLADMSPEMLERARMFAIQEAQEATFRDTNGVSSWFSKAGRGAKTPFGKFMEVVGEGIMPFRKTPANVLVRGFEYSPLGILSTGVNAIKAIKGTATGHDVINSLSKTFTGTGLAYLGYLLAAAGLLRTKDDDDKLEKFNKDSGQLDYSINIGGKSITLDWLSPDCIPLFMGAAFQNVTADGGFQADDALKILGQLTEPMLEMSMLSGVQDAIEGAKDYSGTMDGVPMLVLNSLLSWATQGVSNSLIRQGEQASELYRRQNYTSPDSQLPTGVQRKLSQYFSGIPGYDYQQVDYIDAWGRRQEQGSRGARIAQSFLDPANISPDRSTPYDEELRRLYGKGNTNVLPQAPAFNTEVNGIRLTPEEWERYATVGGEKRLELVGDFLDSEEYKTLDDKTRAEIIGSLYQYSNWLAGKEIAESRGEEWNDSWGKVESVEKAGVDPAAYLLGRKQADTDGSGGTPSNQEVYNWLLGSDYSERQQRAIWDATKGSNVHSWEEYRDTNPVTYLMNAGMTQKGAQRMYAQINTDGRADLTQRELYQYYLAHPEAEELIREYWDNQRGFSDSWDKSKRKPKKDWTD